MSDRSRLLVAAVVAPLAPAVLFVFLDPYAAVISAVYGYAAFVLLGFPTVLALCHFGKLTFLSLVLSGAVTGVASFLVFSVGLSKALGSSASDAMTITSCTWGGFLGALVAGCFGVIAGLPNLRTNLAHVGRR